MTISTIQTFSHFLTETDRVKLGKKAIQRRPQAKFNRTDDVVLNALAQGSNLKGSLLDFKA